MESTTNYESGGFNFSSKQAHCYEQQQSLSLSLPNGKTASYSLFWSNDIAFTLISFH